MKILLIILGALLILLAGCAETISQDIGTMEEASSVSQPSEDNPQERGKANDYPLPPELPE